MVFVVIVGVYYTRITNTILDVADVDAEAILTTAVYSTLADMSNRQNIEYDKFFSMISDEQNNIKAVLTDGIAVNVFTSNMIMEICNYLDEYAKRGINVPLGVFSGVKLLSGFGKLVNFKLIKISSAKCDIVSVFEQAGINQVKHSLYANVIPDVTLKAVGRKRQVTVTVNVLLYENVIVGNVPDTYLGATIIG